MSKKHSHLCIFPKELLPGNIYKCAVEGCKAQLHISSRVSDKISKDTFQTAKNISYKE